MCFMFGASRGVGGASPCLAIAVFILSIVGFCVFSLSVIRLSVLCLLIVCPWFRARVVLDDG